MRVRAREGRVLISLTRLEAEKLSLALFEFSEYFGLESRAYRGEVRLADELREAIQDRGIAQLHEKEKSLSKARGHYVETCGARAWVDPTDSLAKTYLSDGFGSSIKRRKKP